MKRKPANGYKTGGRFLSGKIGRVEFGGFYGSKVYHSTGKYRRVIWQCNHKFRNYEKCKTSHLYEDDLKKPSWMTFIKSWVTKKAIFTGYDEIIQVLTDNKSLDAESAQLQNEVR